MRYETNYLEFAVKAKISRGGGFRGIAEYALGDAKDAELLAGNVTGRNPRALSKEFAVSRQLRPDIARPVWHTSLALPAGEHLADDRWQAVIHDYLDGMGFDRDKHQFFAVRHNDTDHDHVHVITSRVGLDGSVWHGKWEARKAIDLTQVLEERHGLSRTPGYRVKDEKGLTAGEINMAIRTGGAPPKKVLQGLIEEAAEGNPTAAQFAESLVMAGVEVWANIAKNTGKLNGFSFGFEGHSFKGSQLGPKFSWTNKKGLQAQGVSYEQNRDREQLERLSGATAGQRADSDDIRIAVDAGNDQRSVKPISEPDRQPVEGVYIPADQPDPEQARPTPGHDRETVVGNSESGGDGYANPDIPSFEQGERSGRGSLGEYAERGVESLRRASEGIIGSSSGDQRSDGEAIRRGTAGAPVGSQRAESPEQAIDRIDAAFWETIGAAGNQRPGSREGKPEGENPERSSGTPVVASGGPGGGRVDVRKYADQLGILADRHTITPERAREAIDTQIANNPAPARPDGRKASTGRLLRWFKSTKAKLAQFIEKARDYFNDAAVMSAGRGGWSPEEVRSAGFSGDLLGRAEALQAEKAEQAKRHQERQTEEAEKTIEQLRQQQEAKAAEATERARVLEQAKRIEKPEESDTWFFDDEDDDEPSGPSLG